MKHTLSIQIEEISDDIDLKTFKTGTDVLLPDACKEENLLYS
jgi:hypothetical protein